MKLHIDGNINEYYVQTLCMIFFPGEKFAKEESEQSPTLHLCVREEESGISAHARLIYRGRETVATKFMELREDLGLDRTRKIVTGHAVLSVASRSCTIAPRGGCSQVFAPLR